MKNRVRLLLALGIVLAVAACSATDRLVQSVGTAVPKEPPTDTPVPPTPVPVDVVIAEVANAGYAEHVVIRNQDTVVADLSGWQLAEKDSQVLPFAFPSGFALGPGAEVRVYSGRDGRQNNPPESFDWTELNVWDNDGDTATLLNSAGKVVSTLKYP